MRAIDALADAIDFTVGEIFLFINRIFPFINRIFPVIDRIYPVIVRIYPVIVRIYPVIVRIYPVIDRIYPFIDRIYPFIEEIFPFVDRSFPFVEEIPFFKEIDRASSPGARTDSGLDRGRGQVSHFLTLAAVPVLLAIAFTIAGRPVYFPMRFESALAVPLVLWLATSLAIWAPRVRVAIIVVLCLCADAAEALLESGEFRRMIVDKHWRPGRMIVLIFQFCKLT